MSRFSTFQGTKWDLMLYLRRTSPNDDWAQSQLFLYDFSVNHMTVFPVYKASVCLIVTSFPFPQWRCTESHPSMTWQSSPALAVAHPPRVGALRPCSTEAKPWARMNRRSRAVEPRPRAEPRIPYLQQSVNPSWLLSLISGSGLATTNHTLTPDIISKKENI